MRAYDDSAGVTAEFNRNVLHVLNRELDADFEVDAFAHLAALGRRRNEWIEMRLVAQRDMEVKVPGIDQVIPSSTGEQMRTEISAKFTRPRVEAELAASGFTLDTWWTDAQAASPSPLPRPSEVCSQSTASMNSAEVIGLENIG